MEFWTSWKACQKRHQKDTEENLKIENFVLPKPVQNPPKIRPKSMFPKTFKFERFWMIFGYIVICRNPENINLAIRKSLIFGFSLNSCFRYLDKAFLQKTSQKPFQNEVRTLPKSMPKMRCFSTSIFSGFGLDLGGSWAFKWEPSSPFWPHKSFGQGHVERS